MERLKLPMEDKKEIVLYELKKRDPRFKMESISSFVERVRGEYSYSKGAERLFWGAIRELEEEGKVRRYKNGKRKNILPVEQINFERKQKTLSLLDKKTPENRLKVIKNFLVSWERCECMK